MHHQRKPCAASTTASIGQPSAGRNGRYSAIPHQTSRQQPGVQRDHRPGSGPRRTRRRREPGSTPDCAATQPVRPYARPPTAAIRSTYQTMAGLSASAAARVPNRTRAPLPSACPGLPFGGVWRWCHARRAAPTPTRGCRPRSASARSARARRRAGRGPSLIASMILRTAGMAHPRADVIDAQPMRRRGIR